MNINYSRERILDCMGKNEFKSGPEGYQKLMKKIVPWYSGPMREKRMRLLLTILTDG